jgi:hypothetical protein
MNVFFQVGKVKRNNVILNGDMNLILGKWGVLGR